MSANNEKTSAPTNSEQATSDSPVPQQPYYFTRIPISDQDQYGDSFEVKFNLKTGQSHELIDDAKLRSIIELPLITDRNSKSDSISVFLKVPWWDKSLRHNQERLREEIAKEITNKEVIARAKERIEERNRQSRHKTSECSQAPWCDFNIPKMLSQIPSELFPPSEIPSDLTGVFYEFVPGTSFERDKFQTVQSKIKSSRKFLEFALEFAYAVQKIHNQSIAHSFIVPRNIITLSEAMSQVASQAESNNSSKTTKKTSFFIVGFGYARLGDTTGRNRQDNPQFEIAENDKLYLAPECKETNSYGSFWFPADIYSIGAILYAMLCANGAYREPKVKIIEDEAILIQSVLRNPPRDVARLKRLIRKNLQIAAPKIVSENENILKIIDHCLRYNPEDRFSCAEELIELIDIALQAEPNNQQSVPRTDPEAIKQAFNTLQMASDDLPTMLLKRSSEQAEREYSANQFLQALVKEMLEDFRTEQAKMQSGHLEIYGSRDKIITSLCRMLCVSGKGFVYNTMTIPHYWLENNLGPLGRFLTMNKHMVRRGLQTKRLFLVDTDNFHLLDADEQQMLLDHLEAQEDVETYINSNKEESNQNSTNGENVASINKDYGSFNVRVLAVSSDEINTFERDGKTVGYLGMEESSETNTNEGGKAVSQPTDLCLSFYSSTSSEWDYGKEYVTRHISKVRYWVPHPSDETKKAKLEKSKKIFTLSWDKGIPLAEYIGKGYAKERKNTPHGERISAILPKDIYLDKLLGVDAALDIPLAD